jgi:phytoene dehydrogenase-like protein
MSTAREYDVIVVGAGLAGLTSAAYLCRSGYRTLVCEASNHIGGLVNSFVDRGFTFDAGIRAFENSGIVFPMLRQLGIDMECVSNQVTIGIADDLVRLTTRDSLSDYEGLLRRAFPENSDDIAKITGEIAKVMRYMDVLYGIDNPLFMDMTKDTGYLMRVLLPWLIKYQINIPKVIKLNEPVNDYLRRFTTNQALIDLITQHFFQNTPTFFALSYFGLYLDYRYPLGGTGVLADKISDVVREQYGTILTNTPITRIDPDRRQVHTSDGQVFAYRKLVWAADAKAMDRAINRADIADPKQLAAVQAHGELVRQGHGGDSVLTVYYAVDLGADFFQTRSGAHAFYTATRDGLSGVGFTKWRDLTKGDGDGAVDQATSRGALTRLIDEYLAATTYEISCPALRDPRLAPHGQTGLIVSTLMDYELVRHIQAAGWYEEFKQQCQSRITAVLDASIFPGLGERVLFTQCSTPLTLERFTGNAHGAITGWAFADGAMPAENQFRRITRSIDTPLPDIFQAGQWSFSPSGLPISILTGKVAADRIRKELSKQPAARSKG